MSPKFPLSTARQAELAIRALALLIAALGAPLLGVTAAATGHPLLALGSIAAGGPLAVARLIAPPETLPGDLVNQSVADAPDIEHERLRAAGELRRRRCAWLSTVRVLHPPRWSQTSRSSSARV